MAKKGDLFVIEVKRKTVHVSGIAGKSGSVDTRTSWHVVKANKCTKGGKLVEVIDADGFRYKMCEKLSEVGRIIGIPRNEVNPDALWEGSSGLAFMSLPAVRVWSQPFRVAPTSEQLPGMSTARG